jgi:hypothetical protein
VDDGAPGAPSVGTALGALDSPRAKEEFDEEVPVFRVAARVNAASPLKSTPNNWAVDILCDCVRALHGT